MNIGAMRYWIGRPDPKHGWILIWASNNKPDFDLELEVIDRGPTNPWTGRRHDA